MFVPADFIGDAPSHLNPQIHLYPLVRFSCADMIRYLLGTNEVRYHKDPSVDTLGILGSTRYTDISSEHTWFIPDEPGNYEYTLALIRQALTPPGSNTSGLECLTQSQ